MKRNAFDVVVVGGGIAGCATALELYRLGYKVGMLHKESDATTAIETLSPAATQRLTALGIEAGRSIDDVVAWWGTDREERRHYLNARVVQRTRLAEQLRHRAAKCGIEPTLVGDFPQINWVGLWTINTSEKHFISRHLIDATGQRSLIARSQGARRQILDNLFCLSFPIHTTLSGAWTEATPHGWWNVCSDGRSATVSFFSISQVIRKAKNAIGLYWSRTRHLKQMFDIGREPNLCLRTCHSSRLRPCGGPGWLAVGDAAWTVQPLASGGIAKALVDATCIPRFLTDPVSYDEYQRREFESYLGDLALQYSAEARWQREPFWSQCLRLTSV